jgi:hypothetical protein
MPGVPGILPITGTSADRQQLIGLLSLYMAKAMLCTYLLFVCTIPRIIRPMPAATQANIRIVIYRVVGLK